MRPASATRWIPGESCESAHTSPNSRALIHRSPSTASRRIRSKVLVPPPTDWVPTATQERASLPSMPVNLGAMAEVGRQETPTFTWNPVEQMWVQEKGGAAKPPPAPHDVHAIQTWFLDPDVNEWIQTVLGPMGRQLAAQWKGAYRVPETAVVRKTKAPPKRSPLVFVVAAAVVIALIGGVAVAAPGLIGSAANSSPAPSPKPSVAIGGTPSSLAATTAPEASASVAPSADPTADPTNAPVSTPRPATPRPATPKPATPAPTPPPDFVTPQVGAVGTIFRITFIGLPPAAPYRTSSTRGPPVPGYTTGQVPSSGVAAFDLRTAFGSFPPDTYFFTIRAGNAGKTGTFPLTSQRARSRGPSRTRRPRSPPSLPRPR